MEPAVTPRTAPLVLVVEDDKDFRDVVGLQLARHGFEIREADSAGAAWESIHDLAPDAIVMDLRLPGIDGQSLARQLRKSLDGRVVLVAFTALLPERAELSFDAIVEKPDVEAVVTILRQRLGAASAVPQSERV